MAVAEHVSASSAALCRKQIARHFGDPRHEAIPGVSLETGIGGLAHRFAVSIAGAMTYARHETCFQVSCTQVEPRYWRNPTLAIRALAGRKLALDNRVCRDPLTSLSGIASFQVSFCDPAKSTNFHQYLAIDMAFSRMRGVLAE